jgi:hypothetical protein
MFTRRVGLALLVIVAIQLSISADAQVISINFAGGGGPGAPTSLAATDVAGVVAVANWNNATGSVGTLNSLIDNNGAATTASVSYTSNNTWTTGIPNTNANERLMQGYLDTTDIIGTTVTVTGLPSATYNVYVYTLGDESGREGAYTIGTNTQNTSPTLPFSNFVLGDNYALLEGVTGTSFTLTANAVDFRAPINGIQIAVVPGPSSLCTFALLLSPGIWLLRRRHPLRG